MKRRPIVAGLAAALVGATSVVWAGVASADPTEPPSPPPPVTSDGGAPDMTAMMQTCADQMPQTMRGGMNNSMMPGGMPDSMMPAGMPGPSDFPNAG